MANKAGIATLQPRVRTLEDKRSVEFGKRLFKNASDRTRMRGAKGVARRRRVLARDEFTCRECRHVSMDLVVDHVVPLADGGADDASNLQSLCVPCHAKKTKREAQARGR